MDATVAAAQPQTTPEKNGSERSRAVDAAILQIEKQFGRGAIMRLYGLANITVTTASAAGPITIPCLDSDLADRVTADLARITGQTSGDAT